ncbi:uncharacterized protein LOC121875559 [Homarus americanus]|nr:uncharacterized protein LOC121875559 [Homarus americanus]
MMVVVLLLVGVRPPHSRVMMDAASQMVQSEIYGDFMVVMNTKVDDSSTLYTVSLPSLCNCVTACWTTNLCDSASFQTLAAGGECRLSTTGPSKTVVVSDEDARYVYWLESVNGKTWVGSDGLLYLALSQSKIFNAAAACESIPGARLGVYTTSESYQDLKKYNDQIPWNERICVDLKKVNNILTWGDGTPYSSTESLSPFNYVSPFNYFSDWTAAYHTLQGDTFHDQNWGECWVLCQSNVTLN